MLTFTDILKNTSAIAQPKRTRNSMAARPYYRMRLSHPIACGLVLSAPYFVCTVRDIDCRRFLYQPLEAVPTDLIARNSRCECAPGTLWLSNCAERHRLRKLANFAQDDVRKTDNSTITVLLLC